MLYTSVTLNVLLSGGEMLSHTSNVAIFEGFKDIYLQRKDILLIQLKKKGKNKKKKKKKKKNKKKKGKIREK